MEDSGEQLETNNVTELCEPCAAENLSKSADGFCKDCYEFMCQTCFRHHLKAKLCRNHNLGPLNGTSSQKTQRILEEKCKEHAQETIKYFCRTHNCVGCGDCIVSEHQKCDTEFIKDLAKNYEESSEFKTLLRQIQKWETDTAESETCMERNREKNNTLLDKAFNDLGNFRREINDWLDKMENNLEAEVGNISDDNEKQVLQVEKKLNYIKSEMNRIKEELDSNIYHADNLFIRHVECMTRIGHVDKTLSEIKPCNVIKSYTFEPETKVKAMLRAIKTKKKQPSKRESSSENVIKVKKKRTRTRKKKKTTDACTDSSANNQFPETKVKDMLSAIKTETKQADEIESSAETVSKVKKMRRRRKKKSTDTDNYQFPDPRAAGFDVGKRVEHVLSDIQGTVASVDPSGYLSVTMDFDGSIYKYETNELKLL